MKQFISIILIMLVFNCSTTKKTIETNELGFTEFYKILNVSIPKQKIYKLTDKKFFDIKIINHGTKNLYIPKWLNTSSGKNSELFIELYKKNEDKYESYKQESKTVITNRQSITTRREVLSLKNGESICFSNKEIDMFLKIVDTGSYKAKITIDLSDFGYFKLLETEVFFEVED